MLFIVLIIYVVVAEVYCSYYIIFLVYLLQLYLFTNYSYLLN